MRDQLIGAATYFVLMTLALHKESAFGRAIWLLAPRSVVWTA